MYHFKIEWFSVQSKKKKKNGLNEERTPSWDVHGRRRYDQLACSLTLRITISFPGVLQNKPLTVLPSARPSADHSH
jgi:hypothetical protein